MAKGNKRHCTWTYDESQQMWQAECGAARASKILDLKDLGVKYCPNCGLKAVVGVTIVDGSG